MTGQCLSPSRNQDFRAIVGQNESGLKVKLTPNPPGLELFHQAGNIANRSCRLNDAEAPDERSDMNVLMLSATFPYPPTQGGTQVRTFNLLKYLSQSHRVTLVTHRSPEATDAEVAALQDCVAKLVLFPRPPAAPAGIVNKMSRFANFLQQGTPPSVTSSYVPEMQTWVDQAVQSGQYQVLTSEHSVNEIYVRPDYQRHLRTVVNVHSSIYGSCKNQLQTGTAENPLRDRLNLPLLYRYEHRYCRKFSQIVVTTTDDRDQFRAFDTPAEIHVIPNGVDFAEFPDRPSDPGGQCVTFVGAMDNLANIDAATFLSESIFPLLRQKYPAATLMLVGARPTAAIQALGERPGITVTGKVPAMADYLHRATVCVVPMRTGYGIKNKTLEAMAAGIPVVSSDRGLEGLLVDAPGVPLRALRANQIEDYVEAIGRLFERAELRQTLSENARSFVTAEYTWERAGQAYERVLRGEGEG
jgi:polysaccharide biosynthesis protein PslH